MSALRSGRRRSRGYLSRSAGRRDRPGHRRRPQRGAVECADQGPRGRRLGDRRSLLGVRAAGPGSAGARRTARDDGHRRCRADDEHPSALLQRHERRSGRVRDRGPDRPCGELPAQPLDRLVGHRDRPADLAPRLSVARQHGRQRELHDRGPGRDEQLGRREPGHEHVLSVDPEQCAGQWRACGSTSRTCRHVGQRHLHTVGPRRGAPVLLHAQTLTSAIDPAIDEVGPSRRRREVRSRLGLAGGERGSGAAPRARSLELANEPSRTEGDASWARARGQGETAAPSESAATNLGAPSS
jgi:hypothetical protein